MQIEIFTLCDSAHVYSGKAVISGSFNQVIAKKLPVKLNLTLSIRIAFDKEEVGDKEFDFCVNKPDGSLLMPQFKCEAKPSIPLDTVGPLTTIDLNMVLGSISFDQFGIYTISMKYEEKDYVLKFLVQEDPNT